MNQRQRKLLLYLLSQKHYQPIQELCGEFGFSEKTIRNDIKAINAYLHMNEVTSRIQTKTGSGVRMHLMERRRSMSAIWNPGFWKSSRIWIRFYHGMIHCCFDRSIYDGYACR